MGLRQMVDLDHTTGTKYFLSDSHKIVDADITGTRTSLETIQSCLSPFLSVIKSRRREIILSKFEKPVW